MAAPRPGDFSFVIRNELYSWILLIVAIGLTIGSVVAVLGQDQVSFGQIVITVLLAAVAVYAGACVRWHRKHAADKP